MKTYTTKATAKRGAIRELSKGRGMTQDEVKQQFDELATIEPHEDGGFYWRAVQNDVNPRCATPEALANDEVIASTLSDANEQGEDIDFDVNDNKREMAYDAEGNSVPADSVVVTEETQDAEDKPKRKIEFKEKSSVERPTKLVWDIAEEMHAKDPDVRRKDVIAECVERGIAFYTARTQYQQWYTAMKNSKAEA